MKLAHSFTIASLCLALLAMPVSADESKTDDGWGNSAGSQQESGSTGMDPTGTDSTGDGKKLADASDPKAKPEKGKDKEKKDKDAKADAKKDNDPKKDPAAKAAKSGSFAPVDLATRLASFTAGVIVGTPIAVVRRTGIEIVQGEHDLIGEADTWYKKVALVMPGFISVPWGAVSGGASGCMYSLKNAWVESGQEPFSKDVFSLGDVGN